MRSRPRGRLLAPRLMAAVYRTLLQDMLAEGWAPPRRASAHRQAEAVVDRRSMLPVRMTGAAVPCRVHIVGAGLAGLSAAVALASRGVAVVLSDAARQAGGRCRSYHDGMLDMVIDNGNHLVLSGNPAVGRYLKAVGAEDRLMGPSQAAFPFFDVASGRRWSLRPNDGAHPVVDPGRRPARARHPCRRLSGLCEADAAPSRAAHRRGAALPRRPVGKVPAAPAGVGAQYGAGGRLGRSCRRGDARDLRQRRQQHPAACRHAQPGGGLHRSRPAPFAPVRGRDPNSAAAWSP